MPCNIENVLTNCKEKDKLPNRKIHKDINRNSQKSKLKCPILKIAARYHFTLAD